jgi:transcriptional regulator with XRE-family HTH domain
MKVKVVATRTVQKARASNADAVIASIGRRIAQLRHAAGQTQTQLATEARISLKYIQRVEAGAENLTIRSLVRFANILGIAPSALFLPPRRPHHQRQRPRAQRR